MFYLILWNFPHLILRVHWDRYVSLLPYDPERIELRESIVQLINSETQLGFEVPSTEIAGF